MKGVIVNNDTMKKLLINEWRNLLLMKKFIINNQLMKKIIINNQLNKKITINS